MVICEWMASLAMTRIVYHYKMNYVLLFFSLEEKNEKNRANAVRRPANSSTCLFYKKLLPSVVKQFVKWPAVVAVRVPRLSTQWRICALVRVALRIDGDAVVMRRCVMV